MKYKYLKIALSTLAAALLSSTAIHAEMDLMPSDGTEQKGKGPKGKGHHHKKGGDPIMRLINLSDEQLTQMEAAIKKIRNMTPEQKEQLKKKMGKMKDMDPEKREEMKNKMKKFKEVRKNMSEEERKAFQKEMSSLSPEERQQKIKELIQKYK